MKEITENLKYLTTTLKVLKEIVKGDRAPDTYYLINNSIEAIAQIEESFYQLRYEAIREARYKLKDEVNIMMGRLAIWEEEQDPSKEEFYKALRERINETEIEL